MKRAWDIPKAVLKGSRPPIPDHCPRPFADIIIQCWAQDAADRFASPHDTTRHDRTHRTHTL
jgi:hypothetical protein